MRVLGLDPGSRRTGYGVVEASGNAYRCLDHGPIVPGARVGRQSRRAAGARAPAMIASLRGTLLEKSPAGCVIEAGGVGYGVSVSAQTYRSLPAAGETLFLHTRQVVREDALMLFGFAAS